MNAYDVIMESLRQRNDVRLSVVHGNPNMPEVDFTGGPDFFANECVFSHCSEPEKTALLLDFLHDEGRFGWGIQSEQCKLLSQDGYLVQAVADRRVREYARTNLGQTLILSFLALMPDGEKLVIELLDQVPEDRRDGLFLACFRLDTVSIKEKLIRKFREWMKDPSWGAASGDLHALRSFLSKWDRSGASSHVSLAREYEDFVRRRR